MNRADESYHHVISRQKGMMTVKDLPIILPFQAGHVIQVFIYM